MIMKNRFLIAAFMLLGVFLIIDTPLLAQATGTSKESAKESSRESAREAAREARSVRVHADPEIWMAPDIKTFDMGDFKYAYSTGTSSDKSSRLTLSKRYSGHSANKTGEFQIEEGVRKVRLDVEGRVSVGKITITLTLPGGKELTKLTIDDSADVAWSKSITIKEEEEKYYGDWTYNIKAESVEGHYQLEISSY